MAEELQKLRIEVKVDWNKKEIQGINADIKNVTEEVKKSGVETQKTAVNWRELSTALGLGAVAGLSAYKALSMTVDILKEGIKAAIENEIALAKLSFRLSTIGERDIKTAITGLEKWAEELSKLTHFTQTETIRALETFIKYTGDISSAQKLTIMAIKLATAEHKSLTETVMELGTALVLPERGLSRLRREYGQLVGDAKDVTTALENISKNLDKQSSSLTTTRERLITFRKIWDEEIVEKAGKFWIGVLNELAKVIMRIGDAINHFIRGFELFWQKTITASIIGLKHGVRVAREFQNQIDKIYAKAGEDRKKELKDFEEAVKNVHIKVQKDEERLAEERRKIEEKLLDYIKKKRAENTEEALKLLDEEVAKYREAGINKQLIDEYYAMRRMEILAKEKEETEKDLEEIASYYEELNENIERSFEETWSKMRDTLGTVVDGIVSSMKEGLREMIDTGNITAESFEQIWERIKKAFINAITEMITEYVAKMAVIGGIQLLTGIPAGTIATGLGWGGKGLFGLIGLQEGGIVKKPTVAVLGEKGPEAVIPLNKTQNFMPTINLNVNAFDLRTVSRIELERVIRQLKPVLTRELRR